MTRSPQLALAASLFANVFLVGVIGGGLAMYLQRPEMPAPARNVRPISIAGAGLPSPDREHFRQTMMATLRSNRKLQVIARDNREAAAQLFVQSTFDRAAVAAALDRARAADVELRTQLETAAIDFAAGLPADEREILARGLARGGPLHHPVRIPLPAR